MNDPKARRLSEEEARQLWERAARLQAEAATRQLPAAAEADEDPTPSGEGLSLDVVRRAAVEAGIDPSFVEDALVELEESGPARPVDAAADRYLGPGERTTRVTHTIGASIDDTYLALQRVLPRTPYGLILKRVEGPDARQGGVLIFEVPYSTAAAHGLQVSGPAVDIRHYADIKELSVRLRELEPGKDGAPRTEVEVTASRTHARRTNYWVGMAMSGLAALVGAIPGSLITAGLVTLGGPAEAIIMLGVGGTASVGGWFGARSGMRRIYRWGQGKGERALRQMLDGVELDVRTGGAFSAGTQAKSELNDGSDDPLGLGGLLG